MRLFHCFFCHRTSCSCFKPQARAGGLAPPNGGQIPGKSKLNLNNVPKRRVGGLRYSTISLSRPSSYESKRNDASRHSAADCFSASAIDDSLVKRLAR